MGSIRESQISTSVVVEEMMSTPHRVIISMGHDSQTVQDAVKPEISRIKSSKANIVEIVMYCTKEADIDSRATWNWSWDMCHTNNQFIIMYKMFVIYVKIP